MTPRCRCGRRLRARRRRRRLQPLTIVHARFFLPSIPFRVHMRASRAHLLCRLNDAYNLCKLVSVRSDWRANNEPHWEPVREPRESEISLGWRINNREKRRAAFWAPSRPEWCARQVRDSNATDTMAPSWTLHWAGRGRPTCNRHTNGRVIMQRPLQQVAGVTPATRVQSSLRSDSGEPESAVRAPCLFASLPRRGPCLTGGGGGWAGSRRE